MAYPVSKEWTWSSAGTKLEVSERFAAVERSQTAVGEFQARKTWYSLSWLSTTLYGLQKVAVK
jgi:hypothetical protein